jgi:hypothetical protein
MTSLYDSPGMRMASSLRIARRPSRHFLIAYSLSAAAAVLRVLSSP